MRLPLAFLVGAATAVLVACGGGSDKKLLPPVSADRIKNDLADIRQAVEQQECDVAAQGLAALQRDLQRVPPTVDRRLRARLNEGAQKLANRVPIDCQQATTSTTTVPTETTETETTETETTPTETTTTTTPTTTTTTPTTTTPTDTTTTGPSNGGTPPDTTP